MPQVFKWHGEQSRIGAIRADVRATRLEAGQLLAEARSRFTKRSKRNAVSAALFATPRIMRMIAGGCRRHPVASLAMTAGIGATLWLAARNHRR